MSSKRRKRSSASLFIDETVRPEGKCLGADPDVPDVIQPWIVKERPQVACEHPRLHDHRIAARDQQVGNMPVRGEVLVQAPCIV